MASIKRLKMYQKAEQGQRLFSVAPADAEPMRTYFGRLGYKVVRKTDKKKNVVTLVLSKG